MKKCIVLNCANHSEEGEFVGDLCAPCHQFVAEGKGRYSQAYRNALAEGTSAVLGSLTLLVAERQDPTHSISFQVVTSCTR